MSLDSFVVISGLLGTGVAVIVRVLKKRSLEGRDLHPVLQSFMAACNIPVGIYLCLFPFFSGLPESTMLELQPIARYISLSGLALLMIATLAFASALKVSNERGD